MARLTFVLFPLALAASACAQSNSTSACDMNKLATCMGMDDPLQPTVAANCPAFRTMLDNGAKRNEAWAAAGCEFSRCLLSCVMTQETAACQKEFLNNVCMPAERPVPYSSSDNPLVPDQQYTCSLNCTQLADALPKESKAEAPTSTAAPQPAVPLSSESAADASTAAADESAVPTPDTLGGKKEAAALSVSEGTANMAAGGADSSVAWHVAPVGVALLCTVLLAL